jgi:hypothetical protein
VNATKAAAALRKMARAKAEEGSALLELAAAIEADAEVPQTSKEPKGRYVRRPDWIRDGGEARVFDRAIASGSVRAFRPGRDTYAVAEELYAYVEAHPAKATTEPVTTAASAEAPLPMPSQWRVRATG